MANPKYKLTINDKEHVENSYFKMPTITVEELSEKEPEACSTASIPAAAAAAGNEQTDEARKKELDRIKKWIEDRRKTMEATKGSENKEAPILQKTQINEECESGERDKIRLEKELDEKRNAVEEKRKKMEEMIAKMRAAAMKEDEDDDKDEDEDKDEEKEEDTGLDQARMLRKKVQGKIECLNPEKAKEEIKEKLVQYEKREENTTITLKDDMKEVIRESVVIKPKAELQNKLIHDLNELKPPTKKDVHSIFNQLNKIKNS
ncbi:MAG TPA: hypothetical protein DEP72_00170 [Clostridiales bacterium]|nr:MAG: hypothetical protein A2Y18_08290 [Clostridiales bacterium GWD2_32_19]HCC06567.1 hypothetical protein [Clostridiales bacterium]